MKDEILNGHTVDLNNSTFGRFVQERPLTVIDLWAPWCEPCLVISPIIETLAEKYVGKIAFGKLNVENDNNRKLALEYGVMTIPTLLIFKDGDLVDCISAWPQREKLEEMITRHL